MTSLPAAGPHDAPARIAVVGAGTGDARMLTLGALDALRAADVVLVDAPGLLDLCDDDRVGLGSGTQVRVAVAGEPRERMVEALAEAADGRRVVRLVAGDPFRNVAARAEVALGLAEGAEIDVVPGLVPEAVGAEFAGTDLTGPLSYLPVDAVPVRGSWGDPRVDATLVVSTRLDLLDAVVADALAHGRSASEQAIVTLAPATTDQQTVSGRLDTIGRLVADADEPLETPVSMVLGRGAAGDLAAWFESKPMFGWRVLVPRTKEQSASLISRLSGHGARPEEVPTIAVEPPRQPHLVDRAIRGLVEGSYEWVVFTSVNAVRAVREKVEEYGLDARVFSGVRVAVVGNSTRSSLREWGINADLVPEGEHSAAGLATEFPAYDDLLDPINRVFLPRADIAVDTLVSGLADLGWEVEDVTAYRTVRALPPPVETREAIKTGDFDAVVFTSSSTVRNLVGIAGKPHACTVIAAIGPRTAETCREHGLRVDVEASEPDVLTLADELAEFAARRRDALLADRKPVKKPSQRRRRRRSVES